MVHLWIKLFQYVCLLIAANLPRMCAKDIDCHKECASGSICHTRSLNGRCYMFNKREEYWDNADNACKRINARLIEIYDMETMQYIKDVIGQLSWTNNGIWNGAHDRHDEGQWKWAASGKPVYWSYWAPNQPGGFIPSLTGYLTDCVVMRRKYGWRWEDYPCHVGEFRYRYICDYEPKKEADKGMSFKTKALIGFLVGGGILFLLIIAGCSARTYFRKSGSFTSQNENDLNVYYEANGSVSASKPTTSTPSPVKTHQYEPPPSYNDICGSASGGQDIKVNVEFEDVDLLKRQMHEAEIKRQAIEDDGNQPEDSVKMQEHAMAAASSDVDSDFEDVESYKMKLHEAERKRQALEKHGVESVNLIDVNKENNIKMQKAYPDDKLILNIVDGPSTQRCQDREDKVLNVTDGYVSETHNSSENDSDNDELTETNSLLTSEQQLKNPTTDQSKLNNLS